LDATSRRAEPDDAMSGTFPPSGVIKQLDLLASWAI
jgi:hypothetical protein